MIKNADVTWIWLEGHDRPTAFPGPGHMSGFEDSVVAELAALREQLS